MIMFNHRTLESLRCERKRLMYDVDAVERGECWMSPGEYARTLHRLAVIDREIEDRERAAALGGCEMPGNSNLPEVGRRDK